MIRKYEGRDRAEIRRIAYDTAFMGRTGAIFFDDHEILTDALTLYFTDHEPQSCFVAESDNKVVGYLIGAKSAAFLDKVFIAKIAASLFLKSVLRGTFFSRKNIVFIARCLFGLFSGEFNTPDVNRQYPAILHINIDESFRRLDLGSKLINAYLDYLKKEKVNGVHLATMSENSGAFFEAQGFTLLHKAQRSYFRHILKHDIPVYLYGKKLI